MLLALDPGTNSPGIAFFGDVGLVRADHLDVSEWDGLPDGERWLRVGRALLAWAMPLLSQYKPDPLTVIFERPQWYAREKSKGDPNQLAGLTGVAGNLTGLLSCYGPVIVESPKPAEWIGQLPKVCQKCKGKAKRKCTVCRGSAWKTPRGQLIWNSLTLSERSVCPDQNDAIDAVGIGLFALQRLRTSVFSNGRDGR